MTGERCFERTSLMTSEGRSVSTVRTEPFSRISMLPSVQVRSMAGWNPMIVYLPQRFLSSMLSSMKQWSSTASRAESTSIGVRTSDRISRETGTVS